MTATRPMDQHGTESLLVAILRGVPRLDGARCVGRPELFDPDGPHEAPEVVQQRHEAATHLCRACPALADCRSWVDELKPSRRPGGVVAARQPSPRRPAGRPSREAS